MEVTLEWAIATIARQAQKIEEQEQAIVLLEREVYGDIDTSELAILPDDCDPLNTGVHKALIQAGK